VIKDRLCPGIPQRLDQLADTLTGDLRIMPRQAVDLVLNDRASTVAAER
jgi:predicted transcriptional regulator